MSARDAKRASPQRQETVKRQKVEEAVSPPTPSRWRSYRRPSVCAEVDGMDELVLGAVRTTQGCSQGCAQTALESNLKESFLFRDLDQEQIHAVAAAMQVRRVDAGHHVIRQGEEGGYMYFIHDGDFEVHKSGKLVCEYHNKGAFGELALMYNCPRLASVIAKTDGTLYALDRLTFKRIVIQSQRMKRKVYAEFFGTVPLFHELGSEERSQLADCVTARHFHAGETILREGEIGDMFYIVLKGSAEARQGTKVLSQIHSGDYFGEAALLHRTTRVCDIIALDEVEVLCLHEEQFHRLLIPCIPTMERRIKEYPLQSKK